MDTLSLSNNDFHTMFGSTQRCADKPSTPNACGSLDTYAFNDMFSSQPGAFGQDGESPNSNVSDTYSNQQWPWIANSVTPVNSTFGLGSLSTSPSQDCLPNMDSDWLVASAGFDHVWSATDLPLDPSKFNDDLAQPISHSGESKLSGPGLTVASSAHSEVGEPALFGDLDFKAPQSAASESLFWEDTPAYRFSTAVPSESVNAPMPMATAAPMSSMLGFDAIYAKSMTTAPAAMTSTASPDFVDTAAISMPSNFESGLPMDPWPIDQTNGAFNAMNNFDLSSYANPGWF
jgi:hypothetical protein